MNKSIIDGPRILRRSGGGKLKHLQKCQEPYNGINFTFVTRLNFVPLENNLMELSIISCFNYNWITRIGGLSGKALNFTGTQLKERGWKEPMLQDTIDQVNKIVQICKKILLNCSWYKLNELSKERKHSINDRTRLDFMNTSLKTCTLMFNC